MSYMAYHALEDDNEFNPCVGVGASCSIIIRDSLSAIVGDMLSKRRIKLI